MAKNVRKVTELSVGDEATVVSLDLFFRNQKAIDQYLTNNETRRLSTASCLVNHGIDTLILESNCREFKLPELPGVKYVFDDEYFEILTREEIKSLVKVEEPDTTKPYVYLLREDNGCPEDYHVGLAFGSKDVIYDYIETGHAEQDDSFSADSIRNMFIVGVEILG
jgi:hypothetical protein